MNQTCHSINGGSLQILPTVPLKTIWVLDIQIKFNVELVYFTFTDVWQTF